MSFKLITVPAPGHAIATPTGVETYATQPVTLDVYHTDEERVVLRLGVGSTGTVFEMDADARDHLIARLRGEVAQ